MPDSPKNPPSDAQNPENHNTQKRICDFCGESEALLYCRADSAKLCLSCDRQVHSTDPLFTKHTRFQLCDACDSASASILCFSEHSVLCQNCDFELHSVHGGCGAHDRRPLEGFSGCPSAVELAAVVGFESFDWKWVRGGEERDGFGIGGGFLSGLEDESDGFSDLFVWETPAVVSIDELIESTDKSHSFQAMVVPPLPKDRNLSCGQHKQAILNQLRELAKSEPAIKQDPDPHVRLHSVADENEEGLGVQHLLRACQCDDDQVTLKGREARSYPPEDHNGGAVNDSLSGGYVEGSVLNSDKHSSICSSASLATTRWNSQNRVGTETLVFSPKAATHEFNSADRDSALSRYKEKKRSRRYDKLIRYESRKVQAEHRVRIKGRFAKIDHSGNQSYHAHLQ